jgi:hypothetical protein
VWSVVPRTELRAKCEINADVDTKSRYYLFLLSMSDMRIIQFYKRESADPF